LRLAARAAEVNHQLLRRSPGNGVAQILFDQSQRQVNASGNSCGSPNGAILDEYAVGLQADSRESASEIGAAAPMSGRALPVKKPSSRQ
jgi:hypothetical protein